MSGVGSAIQIALSFTGVGAIAVDIAWGIMLAYDMFMWISNSPNWFNLIIDVLCLLTAGSLGRTLGGFAGKAASNTTDALSKLFGNSTISQSISKILPTIEKGLSWVGSKLGQVGDFMVGKMGLTWAKNAISRCISFVKQIVPTIKGFVSKVSVKAGQKTAQNLGKSVVYNNLSKKPLLNFLEKGVDPKWASKFAESQINKQVVGRVEEYIKEKLKNFTDGQVVQSVKKYFGNPYDELVKHYIDINSAVKGAK